jgi:hypothetical protein
MAVATVAELVRQEFEAGQSCAQIAALLNVSSIRSPSGGRWTADDVKVELGGVVPDQLPRRQRR